MDRRTFLLGTAGLAAAGALGADPSPRRRLPSPLGGGAGGGVRLPGPEALRAGAAAVEITPDLERPVYLAGFGHGRRAEGVHDPLFARALVLEVDGERAALVGVDLIGLFQHDVVAARARIESVPAARVIVACTHTHSGPDTLGLWGASLHESGVDLAYAERLQQGIAAAVEQAAAALQPARLHAGVRPAPDGLAHNLRDPVLDPDVTALRFADEEGGTLATLLHFGCHPEVMMDENRQVSADFCAAAVRRVEERLGGTALYLNGALGGMVTPRVTRRDWDEVERVGRAVAETALAALEERPAETVAALRVLRRETHLPIENERLKELAGAGVIVRLPLADDLLTEVTRLDLGPVRLVTLPGEPLPGPALQLKAAIEAEYPLIVALGNDQLGYLLTPEQYRDERFANEQTKCVSPHAWEQLSGVARELLGEGA